MASYLDFEKSIKQIDEDITAAKIRGDEDAVEILNKNLEKEISKVYKNLNEYQRLQLARHPDRPYAIDYIRALLQDARELHGDRAFRDDPSIVCYLGIMGNRKIAVIAEQKGRGTKNKLKRNFGMPHPEGYRKALRVAKLAEKFNLPILFLIDTPGAYPGLGAEERGQSEAIARNLYEFSDIKTPTIAVVIGEGGSGGALAIGVADRLAMLQNSIFSVISPEGCASILWKTAEKAADAAQALGITAKRLLDLGLIDRIINEPLGGAHRDMQTAMKNVKAVLEEQLREAQSIPMADLLSRRFDRIMAYGQFTEK